MGSIAEVERELIEDFELFDDWTEKYQYIIEIGQKLEAFPKEKKTEENKIKGCQSSVWVTSRMDNGKVIFNADSDSSIVKGLAALLLKVFSNQKPSDILDVDLKFIDEIGLSQHLAQTRANGLAAMIKQMKLDALAYSKLGA